LQSLQLDAAAADRLFAAEKKIAVLIDLEDDTARTGKKNILFNYFFKILEDISPKGCFFGIHPGDPSHLHLRTTVHARRSGIVSNDRLVTLSPVCV
jgi:hypothetical protein